MERRRVEGSAEVRLRRALLACCANKGELEIGKSGRSSGVNVTKSWYSTCVEAGSYELHDPRRQRRLHAVKELMHCAGIAELSGVDHLLGLQRTASEIHDDRGDHVAFGI